MAFNYNTELKDASLLINFGGTFLQAFEFEGAKKDISGYRTSAWINTCLTTSPVYDVIGPDAVKFLNSICVNDFTKLTTKGMRHAILCNDKGQILTDGVCIRIAEDRYRTYWLTPVINYYMSVTDLDVHGEDMTGREYFIQVDGEKSLEILENAFNQDLHDIRFATHRQIDVDGKKVEVIRLSMSGNLGYEVHGDIEEFDEIYGKIWEAGQKFGATRLGLHNYSFHNHTECGFPNINLHYPLPWLESGEDMAKFMQQNPTISFNNLCRVLRGSVGDDLESRFVNPYETGCDSVIRFDHEFPGRDALMKMKNDSSRRTVVTLEWNAEDVGAVFSTMFRPGGQPTDDISGTNEMEFVENVKNNCFIYKADRVQVDGKDIGISSGRVVSYYYNAMISLGFIEKKYAVEGTELTLIWGTPGNPQMPIRVKVARYPYNKEFVRNQDVDVEKIPRLK